MGIRRRKNCTWDRVNMIFHNCRLNNVKDSVCTVEKASASKQCKELQIPQRRCDWGLVVHVKKECKKYEIDPCVQYQVSRMPQRCKMLKDKGVTGACTINKFFKHFKEDQIYTKK